MKKYDVMEKEIDGYEEYTITNDGRVYSYKSGAKRELIGSDHNGYRRVWLSKNGKGKAWYIHRLVAQAFLEKPESEQKLEVNHKDGNKSNNYVDNLEWVTHTENMAHALESGLIPERSLPKVIFQIDKDTGEIINEFKSIKEAVRVTRTKRSSISKVLQGMRKTAGGYFWKLK